MRRKAESRIRAGRSGKRWIGVLLAALMMSGAGAVEGESMSMFEEAWYQQALEDSVMSLGAGDRLEKVMERARQGEMITLGTIGGSITEGAGAKTYAECWASRFAVRFRNEFGPNVTLVNAGVGGTPSTFGYMRYQRDVVSRVPDSDPDGLPDLVVIEFSVNDWGEPTNHRCYESMVKEILDAPNEPAVILLFAVFKNGFNLQEELKPIGQRYGLMMVSIKDGIYGHIGKEIPQDEFFSDEYHPTSTGHRVMTDCLMRALQRAAESDGAEMTESSPAPVYGTDFTGLKTVFGDTTPEGVAVERGGFNGTDIGSYHNQPVGWVCGTNFFHEAGASTDPLKITGVFSKCLVAWKAAAESSFGAAEVIVDGKTVMTLRGGEGKWGQSEVVLALDEKEPAEHTLEIRVTEASKKFTVTAVGLK